SDSRAIFQAAVQIDSSLQVLDENFDEISDHSQAEKSLVSTATTTILSSSFNTKVTPEFIARCRQELAEFIGPMANIICQRIIKQNPNMSKSEFCNSLAETIPNSQQAKEFKQRLI
ncbi:MAG: hypothetical protein RLZZ535_2590, partial [Cyanobacteriota bacterium]